MTDAAPHQPRIRHVPRERDEEVLEWLALRDQGFTHRAIAERAGSKPKAVERALSAVRSADRAAHGLTPIAAALALLAAAPAPAQAEQSAVSLAGTTIELHPSETADAEVRFSNRPVNGSQHDSDHHLERDGVEVLARFTYRAGADVLEIAPPPGWTCEPASCRLEQPENSAGTIYLHARTAPGM